MLQRSCLQSRFTRRPTFLLPLFALLTGPAFAQSTWYVGPNAFPPGSGTQGDPYTSIQFAIDQGSTVNGDTVLVLPGTYFENVDFGVKDLELRSQSGPGATLIDGGGVGRVLRIAGGQSVARVEGFTITNGLEPAPSSGGGILVENSAADIVSCTIVNSRATFGGGVAYENSSGQIGPNVTVSNNQTVEFFPAEGGRGGGIYASSSNVIIDGCLVDSNFCGGVGAGIAIEGGTYLVQNSTISQNTADSFFAPALGGGLYISAAGSLVDSLIDGNNVIGQLSQGGGVLGGGLIQRCTIQGNGAGDAIDLQFFGSGGGVANCGTVEDSLFLGNKANGEGGGATSSGPFVRCTFQFNGAQFGGGSYFSGPFHDCRFTQNGGFGTGSADFGGGVYGGDLFDCELDNNVIIGQGAGAHSATLTRCLIRNNVVLPPIFEPAEGGGAYDCTLIDCEVRNNVAEAGYNGPEVALGGGLFRGTATGCVIWGNQAQTDAVPGEGGGAFQSDLFRCVVYDNFAALGAGVEFGDIEHCTIYDNVGEGVRSANSLHNSIVRANAVQIANTFATWCNIEGGAFGVGNIDFPEIFWMPDPGPQGLGRDFHFASPLSPGIDSGDPTSPLDPDGTTADLGAYPWDPSYSSPPTIYCTAKASTTGGCLSEIDSTGTPTLTGPDDFHLTASGALALKPSIVFWGLDNAALPFLGGTLCVLPPLRRTPVQLSMGTNNECDGVLDFAFTQLEMTSKGLSAGDQVYCQYRFRDPADPFGVAFSNALFFTVLP